MSTVIHRFQSMARAHPENDALYVTGTLVSYAELAARTESIRRGIAATGWADDERIGVLTGDDLDTYASILAILADGSAYVPINSKNPTAASPTSSSLPAAPGGRRACPSTTATSTPSWT